jgi:hypothetical protein
VQVQEVQEVQVILHSDNAQVQNRHPMLVTGVGMVAFTAPLTVRVSLEVAAHARQLVSEVVVAVQGQHSNSVMASLGLAAAVEEVVVNRVMQVKQVIQVRQGPLHHMPVKLFNPEDLTPYQSLPQEVK